MGEWTGLLRGTAGTAGVTAQANACCPAGPAGAFTGRPAGFRCRSGSGCWAAAGSGAACSTASADPPRFDSHIFAQRVIGVGFPQIGMRKEPAPGTRGAARHLTYTECNHLTTHSDIVWPGVPGRLRRLAPGTTARDTAKGQVMHARRDHHAGAGQRGRTPARWRAAAAVTVAAALSLAAAAVPASAAGATP